MPSRPKFEVIDDDMAAVLRTKTERERLEIAFGMWRSARRIMRAAIAGEHPDWTAAEIDREVAHRMSHGVV